MGVYYRDSTGSLSTVTVTGIQQPNAFGCQPGANGGVYAATDSSTNAPTTGNGDSTQWVPPPSGYPAANLTATTLVVSNYDKDGITCADVGTACTIASSTVTASGPIPTNAAPSENNAQNGIEIFAATAKITSTKVTGSSYTAPQYCPFGTCGVNGNPDSTYYTASGILIINAGDVTLKSDTVSKNDANVYELWYPSYGGPATQGTWTVSNSQVNKGTNNTGTFAGTSKVPSGDGFGDGIDLDGTGSAGGSTIVQGNTVSGNPEYGIGLLDATGSIIGGAASGQPNTTTLGGGDGIYVGDNPYTGTSGVAANTGSSTGNAITSNVSSSNNGDGILADVTAQDSGTTFTSKPLKRNVRYNAEDLSNGGSGDFGTDNSWSGTMCTPAGHSAPSGIC